MGICPQLCTNEHYPTLFLSFSPFLGLVFGAPATSMGLLENSECESTLPSRFKLCARAVAILHSRRTPTYNEHLVTVAGAEIRIYSDIWDGKKWDLCPAERS